MPDKNNPVLTAVQKVQDDWETFAATADARVARWRTGPDGIRIVNMALEMVEEGEKESPDLFVRITEPFANASSYPSVIATALKTYSQKVNQSLDKDDIKIDHSMLPSAPCSLTDCIKGLTEFRLTNHYIVGLLALVLTPQALQHTDDWPQWFSHFLAAAPHSKTRVIIFDPPDEDNHAYLDDLADKLTASESEQLMTLTCDFNVAEAAQNIVNAVDDDDPGAVFRQHFVNLSAAAEKNDIKKVETIGDTALKLAQQQQWFDMQIVSILAVANVHLSHENSEQALTHYNQALDICHQGQQDEHPLAEKLTFQTLMGKALAELNLNQFSESAISYTAAADIAEQQEEHLNALEAHRMASYTHEKANEIEPAWAQAWHALTAGEQLEKATRESATLPYVGAALLRLQPNRQHFLPDYNEDVIRLRMEAAVGDDWEAKIAA